MTQKPIASVIKNTCMNKEEAYEHVFNDPSDKGSLYSFSKGSVVKDISIEDCNRTKKVCEFWVKKRTRGHMKSP